MNWLELKEESDIKDLLERFGYFHDGCLREMHMWTGTYVDEDFSMTVPGELDTNVKMLFQRQDSDPSAIELLFEGVTGIHIIPTPENYDSIIRDAIILKNNGNFYWADDPDFHPAKEMDNSVNWVEAKNLSGEKQTIGWASKIDMGTMNKNRFLESYGELYHKLVQFF